MKHILFLVSIASLAIGFSARHDFKSGIHGSVEPPDGARKIWAISGRDSVSTVAVSGKFAMEVKPGNWTVVVEAMPSYKNAAVENVMVMESQSTDVGVIKLQVGPAGRKK